MSWGSSSSEREPAKAFMGRNLKWAQDAIKRMADEQRFLITQEMSVPELGQLLIRPADYEVLTRAFEVNRLSYPYQELKIPLKPMDEFTCVGGEVGLTVAWKWDDCKDGFFVPGDGREIRFQPEAPEELREKYSEMFARLQRVTYEWGMVMHVFTKLNANGFCNTPQQMRYVWPAIRHIVDRFDEKLGRSLVDSSARAGDKARVPAEIADLMVPTVNIVARSTLLDKVNMNVNRAFGVTMWGATYSCGNNTFQGMI